MKLEIKTTGIVKKAPNRVFFNFNLHSENVNYNEVIKIGAKDAIDFRNALGDLDINLNDLKTIKYKVTTASKRKEEIVNGYKNTEYVFDHYDLNQSFTLEIGYNKDKMFDIIDRISKLDNPPTYTFDFTLDFDTNNRLKDEALEKAMLLAIEKAEKVRGSIYMKAGFEKSEYIESKIVELFTMSEYDRRYAKADMMFTKECASVGSLRNDFSQTITPDDIEVEVNVISVFNFS